MSGFKRSTSLTFLKRHTEGWRSLTWCIWCLCFAGENQQTTFVSQDLKVLTRPGRFSLKRKTPRRMKVVRSIWRSFWWVVCVSAAVPKPSTSASDWEAFSSFWGSNAPGPTVWVFFFKWDFHKGTGILTHFLFSSMIGVGSWVDRSFFRGGAFV